MLSRIGSLPVAGYFSFAFAADVAALLGEVGGGLNPATLNAFLTI
jgi:hypothetical protein